MEHQMIAVDMAKGRSNLIHMLLYHARIKLYCCCGLSNSIASDEDEIPDTSLEEFEKGIEEFFKEE
jgi:hypothetical protein